MLNVLLHLLGYYILGLLLYRAFEELDTSGGKDPAWMKYVFALAWFPTLVVFVGMLARDSFVDWYHEVTS